MYVYTYIVYHQEAVRHFHFYLLLKKATAVAETSNTTFLASVNYFIYLLYNLSILLTSTVIKGYKILWSNESHSICPSTSLIMPSSAEKSRERVKRWKKENLEKYKEQKKRYKRKHTNAYYEQVKTWRRENPDL